MGRTRYDLAVEPIDTEELATRAVQQARRLTHQAELAARVATDQAVALLHGRGLSQRQIAKLTGLSKSDVARRIGGTAPPGPLLNRDGDDRVYALADEWIWGSRESALRVADIVNPPGDGAGTPGSSDRILSALEETEAFIRETIERPGER